jgi:hypothetical protein
MEIDATSGGRNCTLRYKNCPKFRSEPGHGPRIEDIHVEGGPL